MDTQQLERRVSAGELAQLLGVTSEWVRRLEKAGRIPPARRDPGGRRKFWLASEAQSIVAGTKRAAP